MSYPQAPASREIFQGQQFYRLFTPIGSSGDIYEVDVSSMAFCIGAQSDLARARVTYYDPENASHANSFVVSTGGYFVGRVDSFGSTVYRTANTKAKILVTPEDLVETPASILQAPVFTTGGVYDAVHDLVAFSPPQLDLLAFFNPPSSLPIQRADRYYRGCIQVANRGAGTGATWLLIPYYGRKYASIKFTNGTPNPYVMTVYGASIFPAQGAISTEVRSQALQLATSNVLAATTVDTVIKATSNGLWDYLVVEFAGNACTISTALAYTVQTSDTE